MNNSWIRFDTPMPKAGENVEVLLDWGKGEQFKEAHFDGKVFRVAESTYLPASMGGSVVAWRKPQKVIQRLAS